MTMLGEHAVVLGASMAGLLAARALSEAYRHVTVVERDVLPEGSADRRGVPQGRHAHALLSGGARILDELFPRFLPELEADRVPVFRDMAEAHFVLGGHQLGPQELVIGAIPERPTVLVLLAQENGWWMLWLSGYGSHHLLPRRAAGFRRRDLQLQPHLRAGHDHRRAAGHRAARVPGQGGRAAGPAVLPGRRETDQRRVATGRGR
jgi:NADPH-dependent 2,4-dienoyl-CoA reductase/sulfur reductase-like enzyme